MCRDGIVAVFVDSSKNALLFAQCASCWKRCRSHRSFESLSESPMAVVPPFAINSHAAPIRVSAGDVYLRMVGSVAVDVLTQ